MILVSFDQTRVKTTCDELFAKMELGLLTCSFLSKPFLLVCEELSICVNNPNPNLNPYSDLMVN